MPFDAFQRCEVITYTTTTPKRKHGANVGFLRGVGALVHNRNYFGNA